jgi:hypothetical protein
MMTFLVFLLLLYNAWLVSRLLKSQPPRNKHSEESTQISIVTDHQAADDVVGKSHFKMEPKTPKDTAEVPQTASYPENENIKNADVTFADEIEETVAKRVPDEKLDEVFTHVVTIQQQQDDEKAEMDDDSSITGYASGASFDEIGQAMKVSDSDVATKEEKYSAGKVFTGLEGNELFNQIIDSSSQRAIKIKELMDSSLGNSITREGEVTQETVQLQNKSEMPAEMGRFDIRDFV